MRNTFRRATAIVTSIGLVVSNFVFIPIVPAHAAGGGCGPSGDPYASFVTDTTGIAPHAAAFTSYSQGCGDNIVAHHWDFGDGAVQTGNDTTTQHTFAVGNWSVSLTVTDEAGLTATTTKTMVVRETNTAPVATDDAFTFVNSGPYEQSGQVLTNDTDAEGDALRATLVTSTQHGTLTLYPYGNFNYTPEAGYYGQDSFTYQAYDDFGGASTATVTLTLRRPNTPPVANDDTATTQEDQAVTFPVLANDSDADGDALTVRIGSHSQNAGTFVLNADQTITYTPAANYTGTAYVSYSADDGFGGSDWAQANITVTPVNDAPTANDDAVSATEDQAVTFNVQTNDSDVEPGYLDVQVLTSPTHGTLSSNGGGSFTYTPAANYNGADSFTYQVVDAQGAADSATVTISVNGTNDAPVAQADTATTAEDQPTTFSVLGNDTDVDGDPLTVRIVSSTPGMGTFMVNADQTVSFAPAANYNGTGSLTYEIADPSGAVSTTTVQVTVTSVNDNPTANFTWSQERRKVSFAPTASDIEGNSLNYHWNFGDGATSSQIAPAHNYHRGTYVVTLTVTDSLGGSTVVTKTVVVE